MRTEGRFLIAITLMMGVLVGTNILFPPIVPDEVPAADSTSTDGLGDAVGATVPGDSGSPTGAVPSLPDALQGAEANDAPALPEGTDEEADAPDIPRLADEPEKLIRVSSPLYEVTLSNHGAVLRSVRLNDYESFTRDGPVELVEDAARGMLGGELVVGSDSVSLADFVYSVAPEGDLQLPEGSGPETLTFRYDHPEGRFFSEIRYTFHADRYVVDVDGNLPALDRAALFIDLGPGLAYNELDEAGEERVSAFAGNSSDERVTSRPMTKVDEPEQIEGPLLWGATKTQFFLAAILPGVGQGQGQLLSGVWAEPHSDGRAGVRVGAQIQNGGAYGYQAYLGPMERARLTAMGDQLQEVNPYGWRFLRPIIRPVVGGILWVLNFLHDRLLLGYGWVLIVFGVVMRILLWPLNQKAMRAQIRNMAAQPLMQEAQKKYKDNPERLQKEMVKLYKEHGFNPLGGCLPMLLPWPVLIALFFVFQNTIELRGESFLWLPDLAAPDPLYLLPLFLGLSMFLLQFISLRSMDQVNPQMKMMMWFMPIMMMFIFFRFASGLNLYYATSNVATLPQQWLIAKERKKARAAPPLESS